MKQMHTISHILKSTLNCTYIIQKYSRQIYSPADEDTCVSAISERDIPRSNVIHLNSDKE